MHRMCGEELLKFPVQGRVHIDIRHYLRSLCRPSSQRSYNRPHRPHLPVDVQHWVLPELQHMCGLHHNFYRLQHRPVP